MLKNKLATIATLFAFLSLTACSGAAQSDDTASPEGSGDETVSIDTSGVEGIDLVPELAEMVPAEIRERGVLNVATTSSNMPATYIDEESGELVGHMIDLYEAVGQVLDLDVEFEMISSDGLQIGVESGRYDVAAMSDRAERQEDLDFIDIHEEGTGVIAHISWPVDTIDFPEDLCGTSGALTVGDNTEQRVIGYSEECEENGAEPIEMNAYSDTAAIVMAVRSGQNDFGYIQGTVAAGYAQQDENLKLVANHKVGYYAWGVLKDEPELRDALHEALFQLVDDGHYQEILENYGVSEYALPELPLNQGE